MFDATARASRWNREGLGLTYVADDEEEGSSPPPSPQVAPIARRSKFDDEEEDDDVRQPTMPRACTIQAPPYKATCADYGHNRY